MSYVESALPMELVWLEDFLALAEALNFSRAAEARHVTQPAFSRRIRALEGWIGAALSLFALPGIALDSCTNVGIFLDRPARIGAVEVKPPMPRTALALTSRR